MLTFNDYNDCLLKNEIVLKSRQRFKNKAHNVYTEKVNKIALSSNADKILRTFDGITTYPLGTSAFKVCKSESDHYLKQKNEIISKSQQDYITFLWKKC